MKYMNLHYGVDENKFHLPKILLTYFQKIHLNKKISFTILQTLTKDDDGLNFLIKK